MHDGRAGGPELARLLLSADARLADEDGAAGRFEDVYRFNSELQEAPKKQAPEKKKEAPEKREGVEPPDAAHRSSKKVRRGDE